VRQTILKAARDLMEGTEPAVAQNAQAYGVLPSRMVLPSKSSDDDIATALEPHTVPQA